MGNSQFMKILGSSLAGAVGFAVGFYSGLFVVLTVFGLSASAVAFTVITGSLGSLGAGAAIAATVASGRKSHAMVTAAVLGALLVIALGVFDADAGAAGVGGLALAVVTSVLVRTGSTEALLN